MSAFAESDAESAALTWLSDLGWQVRHGSEIAPDGLFAKRQDYGRIVLEQLLRGALLPKFICGESRVRDAERLFLQHVPNTKKED